MHAWDIPMYPTATVGRLVKLSSGRVRRWLRGYGYKYTTGPKKIIRKGYKEPVVIRKETEEPSYASFLDLIDLLFVKEFLEYGISLQRTRKALYEAEEILGGHHFAQKNFFTDGKNIYLQVKDEADALIELLSGGQWVIASIIKELSHQIEFDKPTGFAKKWYPLGPRGYVVLDPEISFGKPSLINRGIATANVYDFFIGENKNIGSVCNWMDLKKDEVKAAVSFESILKAA